MKRLAEEQIYAWKDSPRRKPLIIRGARQTGKTWLVENCLATKFERFVKIDFEKRRDLHNYFSGNLSPKAILPSLEIEFGYISPGSTLLFFDEIQSCPRAIMALRYFYEELPELHLVCAGSLLEFSISEISFPVGRVQYLHLYPMCFYEYLLAIDKKPMAEASRTHPSNTSTQVQAAIQKELKNYFFVGGMPECVKTYSNNGSYLDVFAVQSEILESYRDDFSKYTPQTNPTCLDAVLLTVAKSAGEQLKYTRLDNEFSGQTNKKAFNLLEKAKIIYRISSCDPSGLPLGASTNPRKFKAAFLDIGLLQRLCKLPVEVEIQENDLLAIYRGKLAEQFVAQELLVWQEAELYYWSREARSSNAEVDFLTVINHTIHPIEVKSGKGGSLKSLHLMLSTYQNCPHGLVFYNGEYKTLPEQKIIFMPLYSVASCKHLTK